MNHCLRFLPPARHFLLVVSCVLLVACASQPLAVTREPSTLQLVAADTCELLAEELIASYEEAHPWVTVRLEVFNASVAERTLRAGDADVALLSWLQETTAEEALWSQPFAEDGIAVIAHPGAPFSETGLAHLQDIYRGHVQEWGGVVLTVVSREDGSGTRSAFERIVLGNYYVTRTAVVMPSSEAVIEYVSHTPGAIGYVSTLRLMPSAAESVWVLPVEGVLPTPATISDGNYVLSHWLYLASTDEPTGEAREFAQWVLGPPGQDVIDGLRAW